MMDNRLRKKKKRTENWSQADKNLLRSLISGNLAIIENKNCDTNTNKLKKDCWDSIWTLFNAKCETKRRVIQLQFQWRGMKTKARKIKSTNFKKELADTDGGGPPPLDTLDEELADMIETKPYEFMSHLNKFDDSNEPEPQFLDSFQPKLEESDDNSELEINNVGGINAVIDTPADISPRPNSFRPINSRKHLRKLKKKNVNEESSFKLEIFELTKLHMTREHEQRMEVLRLEQECRLKELRKFDLEIEMLERK